MKKMYLVLFFINYLIFSNTSLVNKAVFSGYNISQIQQISGVALDEFSQPGVGVLYLKAINNNKPSSWVSRTFASVQKAISGGQANALFNVDQTHLNRTYGNSTLNNTSGVTIDKECSSA